MSKVYLKPANNMLRKSYTAILLSKTHAFTQSKLHKVMLHTYHLTIYKWGIYLIRNQSESYRTIECSFRIVAPVHGDKDIPPLSYVRPDVSHHTLRFRAHLRTFIDTSSAPLLLYDVVVKLCTTLQVCGHSVNRGYAFRVLSIRVAWSTRLIPGYFKMSLNLTIIRLI